MYITKLKLQNFKKFDNLELNFSKGLNVVLGDNEAGKSTVTSAILEVLFADPTTKSKQFFAEIYPWTGEKEILIEMDFVSENTNFRIKKDFHKQEALLTNLDTGKKLEKMVDIKVAVEKVLGFPSKEIFMATAFIRQLDVTSIDTTDDLVGAIHQIAVSSGNKVNVQRIIRDLENNLRALRVGIDRPAKNPGPKKIELDNIRTLKIELEEKKKLWEQVNTASKSQKTSSSKLGEINEKISEINELLENNKKLKEATKRINDLDVDITRIEEELRGVRDLNARRESIKAKLADYKVFASENLDDITRKLSGLSGSKKFIDMELTKFRKERQEKKFEKIVLVQEKPKMIVPIIFAVIIICFGIVGAFVLHWAIAIGAISVAVFGIVIYYLIKKGTVTEIVKIDQGIKSEFDYLVSEMEKKQLLNEQASKELLDRLMIKSAEEFFTKKAEFVGLLAEYNEIDAELKGLLGGKSLDNINANQINLMKEKKEIGTNELTEKVKNSSLNSDEYLRKTRELDNLYLEKRKYEEEHMASKVRVSDSIVDYDDIVELEERLEKSEKDVKYYNKKEQVLELVIVGLNDAIQKTAQNASKKVSESIEKYLAKITNGNYNNARLTKNLDIEVFSDKKNEWIHPIKYLSKGTIDQIYFLTRLAFLDIISKGKSAPLILDDPFVTFDNIRKLEVKKILNDYLIKGQVILFSHDTIYEDWGDMIKIDTQYVSKGETNNLEVGTK